MSTASDTMHPPTPPRGLRGFPIMPWVVAAALFAALYIVFIVAPPDGAMGEVHRIFYFHVASAFAALIGWIGCALASLAYLFLVSRPRQRWFAQLSDRLAYALGEIGVLFGIVVLITGPLWAKPEWGTYWTWEPRLVLMMLTQFLFIGYLVLRSYARRDVAGKKLAAGIAVIGGPAVYLIHVAVLLWGGNHPKVVTEGGDGIRSPEMQLAFAAAVISILLFASYLVYLRAQHHKLVDDLEEGFLELADKEDSSAS